MRAQVSVGFIKPVIDRVVLDMQGAHRVGDDDVLNEVAEILIDSAITIDQRTAGKMGNWKPLWNSPGEGITIYEKDGEEREIILKWPRNFQMNPTVPFRIYTSV